MSSWGSILSSAVSAYAPNSKVGALVNFGSSISDKISTDKKSKKVSSAYYAALANQKQLSDLATQTAAQRAQFEESMRSRILTQTGDLGSTLRQAQTNLGAMPQFDQAKVNSDYANTKATMTNDFTDLLKLVESQGRSSQIERLGGANSYGADSSRMSALIKRYSPELQKIDDAAYDSALNRATNTQNLVNKNRSDTLGEIKGVYDAQIDPETKLLGTGSTDITTLANTNSASINNDTLRTSEQNKGATDKIATDSLSQILKAFNR